jgi:VWFA-related protein
MWWKTLVTFALSLAIAGYGWLPSQSSLAQDARIRVSSAVVNVPVAVYDKKTGVVYQNLKKEDFQILEDGVKQEITNFAAPESALNLVLLLENNRRLREVDRGDYQPLMDTVVAAALAVPGRHMRQGDYAALVSFDMRPKVECDFTSNPGELRRKVMEMARDFGAFSESNLHDALLFALTGGKDRDAAEYKGLVEVEGRTALLVIASGFDTFSRASLSETLKTVERAGVPIYTIGIADLLYKRLAPWLSGPASLDFHQAFNRLRSIARSSGGQYYPLTFESQAQATLENIFTLLRNKYSIGYMPSNPRAKGKRRKIEVMVDVNGDGKPDNERLVIQHRDGYREPDKGEERPAHLTQATPRNDEKWEGDRCC